jgi:hypothetical protein
MEVYLVINHSYFGAQVSLETVSQWKNFWRQLCDMAYYRRGVCEKLIVLPKKDSDKSLYLSGKLKNEKELHFDTVWKEYSHVGDLQKVPQLKELYVPLDLFVCPGVWSFMEYCFPNCKIVFWDYTLSFLNGPMPLKPTKKSFPSWFS